MNDPDKSAPGACGCGAADVDRDNDGVADCLAAETFRMRLEMLRRNVARIKIPRSAVQAKRQKRLKLETLALLGEIETLAMDLPAETNHVSRSVRRLFNSGQDNLAKRKQAVLQGVEELERKLSSDAPPAHYCADQIPGSSGHYRYIPWSPNAPIRRGSHRAST